jgi:hypothetical protein
MTQQRHRVSGARDEFHLAAIVQNLKTLAGHVWRPPPNVQAACVARAWVAKSVSSVSDLAAPKRGAEQMTGKSPT